MSHLGGAPSSSAPSRKRAGRCAAHGSIGSVAVDRRPIARGNRTAPWPLLAALACRRRFRKGHERHVKKQCGRAARLNAMTMVSLTATARKGRAHSPSRTGRGRGLLDVHSSARKTGHVECIERAWIMALVGRVPFGMSLPHRSPDGIAPDIVRAVAQRAEALGFRDLWVTENTLDHVTSYDALTILTYAAAVTTRIRLGASGTGPAGSRSAHGGAPVGLLGRAERWPRGDGCRDRPAVSLQRIRDPGRRARRTISRAGLADPDVVVAGTGDTSGPLLSSWTTPASASARCSNRCRSGWALVTPTRCAVRRRWPMDGWVPAAPQPRNSAALFPF